MIFKRNKIKQGVCFFMICCLYVFKSGATEVMKIACIGNSVTYGYGLQNPSVQAYPAQLQQLLGPKYQVGNFGHSGATLLKNGHNPYFKTQEFRDALAFKPDIAIVHLGLNDTDPRNWPQYRDQFERDYHWLLDTLQEVNPKVKLYVCVLTPIFSGHPRFKSGTFEWYKQIQELLPFIAKTHQAQLINLRDSLDNRPDLFLDNLHPNEEGAEIMAKTVFKKITGNYGGLQLPRIFADHMVLQRGRPIHIYGIANAGQRVEVRFGEEQGMAEADENGCWTASFRAMEAGGPYQLLVRSENRNIVLNDILVGDVWLCSGQSNMAFPLRAAQGGATLAQQADSSVDLRLYHLQEATPTNDKAWSKEDLRKANALLYFNGTWNQVKEEEAASFSAIGYVFGNRLQKETGVPIGLIQLAVGGSGIESWIDRYSLENDPLLVDMLNNWRKSDFIMDWNRGRADVNLKFATNPRQRHPYEPAYNFEAGVTLLKDFAIKGVIWYQGESNVHNPELYTKLFKTFIQGWRQFFKQDTLPFYYVQLAGIDRPAWPYFRDVQRRLQQEIPNTWMAISADVGDSLNVHPTNKIPVGERLANLALAHSYGRDIMADAPEVKTMSREGAVLNLYFTANLKTADGKPVKGFEWIDAKGNVLTTEVEIQHNIIRIKLPKGVFTKAVCYAWKPFTRANLVSEQGVPVSTFSMNITE